MFFFIKLLYLLALLNYVRKLTPQILLPFLHCSYFVPANFHLAPLTSTLVCPLHLQVLHHILPSPFCCLWLGITQKPFLQGSILCNRASMGQRLFCPGYWGWPAKLAGSWRAVYWVIPLCTLSAFCAEINQPCTQEPQGAPWGLARVCMRQEHDRQTYILAAAVLTLFDCLTCVTV